MTLNETSLTVEQQEKPREVDDPRLSAQTPWPGLEAYAEDSKDFFKGRDDETAELLRLIRSSPLTVLYGKSGLGKTSLLLAGAFPLLRAAHYLPVRLHLDFSGRSENPLLKQAMQCLQSALANAKAEIEEDKDELPAPREEHLWEFLHRKRRISSPDNYPLTIVLVFDQFEELFSRNTGNAELITQVLNDLEDLIENRITPELVGEAAAPRRSQLVLASQNYKIVFSVREECLADMHLWEKKVPSLLRSYLRLEPISRSVAISAVEEAGKAVLAPGAAPAIVDFVGRPDHPLAPGTQIVVEPALLSLCCSELNRKRGADAKIGKDLVDVAGESVLEKFYREAFEHQDVMGLPDAALFVEEHLIQGDYRGDYPKQEALDSGELTERQLAALTNEHLLRIVTTDTARIELMNDRLVPIVAKARDRRRAKVAEAERDKEKIRNQQLLQSIAARSRAIWACVFALAVAVLAFFLMWIANIRAESRELAASAMADLAVDPQRGIEHALDAQSQTSLFLRPMNKIGRSSMLPRN
jgi:hypothetical protein